MGHENRKRKARNNRNKIICGVFCFGCGVFATVSVISLVVKDVKKEVGNFADRVSERIDSELIPMEAFQGMASEVAEYLPDLDTNDIAYPELKEDSSSALPQKEESQHTEKVTVDKQTPPSKAGRVKEISEADVFVVTINDADYRVRLVGVDVPETAKLHTDSADSLERKVIDIVKERICVGEIVYLEYEKPAYDKYSRLLAYVFLSDGTDVQKWLLESGYAKLKADDISNPQIKTEYTVSAVTAEKEKRGIWAIDE